MNNTNNKTYAEFNSKYAWVTLWILSVLSIILALYSMSRLKVAVCIIFCAVSFVLSFSGILIGIRSSKAKLEIDEKYIYYKTLFGHDKYFPIDSVSAVGTGILNTVYVVCPSCRLRCMFVRNRSDIVKAIKEKIENRA